MKWEVQIGGNDGDLAELSKSLKNKTVNIIRRDTQYYLISTAFNQLTTPEKVHETALIILPILTGATRLALGGRTPIQLMNIGKINEDGTRDVHVYITETAHARDNLSVEKADTNGTVEVMSQADKVSDWLSLASSNKLIAKAFRLFGKEKHDWVSLYRIFEVIEEDMMGVSNIVKNEWATKSKIRLFKHTSSSPTAVGDNARHGKEAQAPPKKPMELEEARSLIKIIFHSWLRHKQERKNDNMH